MEMQEAEKVKEPMKNTLKRIHKKISNAKKQIKVIKKEIKEIIDNTEKPNEDDLVNIIMAEERLRQS